MTALRLATANPGAATTPGETPGASAAPLLRRLCIFSVLLGFILVGGGVLWAVVASAPSQFFRSYLLGFLFCSGIALGCLGLLMISHLTGGAWGLIPRRIFEAAGRSLPFVFVLFIPILIGMPWLYGFAHLEKLAQSEVQQRQHAYLNPPFFIGRSIFYFALWIVLAYLLASWSRRQDGSDALRASQLTSRMRALSGPGLFVFCLAVSFAATDWVMVLLPEWYSTIFGMLVLAGQGLSAYAFVIVMLASLRGRPPFAQGVSPKLWHDLGKLLQAFVLLWAYIAFSQLLIIWAGNLPREISWYMSRLRTSWVYLGVLLLLGHFALPFFLLLFRWLKQRPGTLGTIAGFVLLMRLCDQLWLVEPNFHPQGLRLHLLDVILPLGVLGLWFSSFAFLLSRRLGLPLADPGITEALAHRQSPPGGTLS